MPTAKAKALHSFMATTEVQFDCRPRGRCLVGAVTHGHNIQRLVCFFEDPIKAFGASGMKS